MASYKSAIMVSPMTLTVATTAGYTIRFEAGRETFVPAMAVRDCLKYGAKEVKRIKNSSAELPEANIVSTMHTDSKQEERDVEEIEISSESSVDKSNTAGPSTDSVFTPSENKIRSVIKLLVEECDPDNFTGAGILKVSAFSGLIDDITVTSKKRDTVWDKMVAAGDIPSDWPDPLYEDVETNDDDTEAA